MLFKPISKTSDYKSRQSDINLVTGHISSLHLSLSPSKWKLLVASKKRHTLLPSVPLLLNETPLEIVSNYKYLGVIVNSRLNWSDRIAAVTSKRRKLLGLLYRQFYPYMNSDSLLALYLYYIRPLLEYASPLWDPHTTLLFSAIESVQKFA